ncbi:MAG TPA: hypothetical protein VFE12_14880 [Acetobacteraceae bacterium]|nr:hypothetical protein [Acetobacteraceae bacterium]
MIPHVYWTPYLIANAFALIALAIAFWRPHLARWIGVGVFGCAAAINTWTAWSTPDVYLQYADVTSSVSYRAFILGWFSAHIPLLVWSIAAGQLEIAVLLAVPHRILRMIGLAGALTFLLAIAPLGVGAGFPFSLTFGAALAVAVVRQPSLPTTAEQLMRWAPRAMAVALVMMLFILASDGWFGATLAERAMIFAIHLLPGAAVLGTLAIAWRHPRAGGVLCFGLAIGYALLTGGRISWLALIALPLIVDGTLFLLSSKDSRRMA